MKIILTRKADQIKVDDADFSELSRFTWHVTRDGYVRNHRIGFMHRFLLKVPPGLVPDHIDNDPLNNQRSNLRVVTREENAINKRLRSDNTSGFKGVCWDPWKRTWAARLYVRNAKYELGNFRTAEEAARAYDDAVRELHPCGRLNFPDLTRGERGVLR